MIRYNLNFKLFFLIKVFFIYFIICLKSYADTPKALSDLVILGADNAPVKIKVFSSLTCPHCANFHIKIVSEIKKKYVESGKVQLIFIDFPLDQAAFNASKLLHCLDQKKQIAFLDTIYENQIVRLRSLTEDYEWMTFFEKDFSILDASSYTEKSGSSLPAKSQEHLQLVQNKLKVASAENSVTETKTKDLAKSVS